MATKTTKKSTKTAATRTAKKPASRNTGRSAACRTCKKEEPHFYTFVALALCFMITAFIATVILVGTKINNDALAKNLEADRTSSGSIVIYADPEEAEE